MAEDAGGDEPDPSRDAFALTREETRATFEYQVDRLQEIDAKAIEILKANLLLIGILVTAGSILIQTEFDAGGFLNVFTGFGALLLFVSTGLAGVTYTSSNLRGGLDAGDIERIISRHTAESDEEFEKRLLRSYGRWIEYNAQVTAVNDMLASATVLLVITAFAYVIVGVAVGVSGDSGGARLGPLRRVYPPDGVAGPSALSYGPSRYGGRRNGARDLLRRPHLEGSDPRRGTRRAQAYDRWSRRARSR